MQVEWKVLSHDLSDLLFGCLVVIVPVRGEGREVEVGTKVVGQAIEMQLASHLETDDGRNPIEVLAAFDLHAVTSGNGDVEVLTNAAQTSANTSGSAKDTPQRDGGGFGVVGGADIGRCRNFNERKSQSVEIVDDLLAVSEVNRVQFSGAVFLKAHHVNTHGPLGRLEDTVRGDEGRALKTAGVGAVHHRFSHGLNQ